MRDKYTIWKTILAMAALYGFWVYATLPNVGRLALQNPTRTAFMDHYEHQAMLDSTLPPLQYRWVPFSQISPHLKNAALIAEDDAFLMHEGIDVEQIKSSIEAWKKGKRLRGASTITQQLAKNLYLSPSRSLWRKAKEFLIAHRLENYLTKPRILELYLNVIEWGKGIYGAEAASRFYFNKSAKDLTARDAAFLAAIIPNPKRLTDSGHNQWRNRRQQLILKRLERRPSRF